MARICPHCHKVFDGSGKYCSVRCRRELRRQQWRILQGTVAGMLLLALTVFTAPRSELRPEPSQPISMAGLEQIATGDECPICAGKGKVDCSICVAGKIFYMGTSAECHRCNARGWIDCSTCSGTGTLQKALSLATKTK